MLDESLYLTTHETALAVVATAMKKARLPFDALVINLFMGGLLFTAGGLLHVMIESYFPDIYEHNPGIVMLLQGLVYPIGLFYVVIMGVDLFNSNILFFLVGVVRGAVSIMDLVVSWMVSYWLNLVGNIFVCYVICFYSGVGRQELFVTGSRNILEAKASFSFAETLVKSIAGNFFVCLAIYLQLMVKPLHVKYMMMTLPIFTFVAMGFTHAVADMFMIVMGLINGADVSVKTTAWKLFLPAALGNIIGGSFFGIVIPWYLHLVVVERDLQKLHLPRYDVRDEQPELNQDSRVVRVSSQDEKAAEMEQEEEDSTLDFDEESRHTTYSGFTGRTQSQQPIRSKSHQSPANVFPVLGMGTPRERELSIASGFLHKRTSHNSAGADRPEPNTNLGLLIRSLTRASSRGDIESQRPPPAKTRSSNSISRRLLRFAFNRESVESDSLGDLMERYERAGITKRAAGAANEAAGTCDVLPGSHISRKNTTVSEKLAVDPKPQ